MIRQNSQTRDEVLFAFHQTFDNPTAEQIIEWTQRYPQFADDIRAHAAIAKDWAAHKDIPAMTPDETMLERGYSRALNAFYNAELASTAKASVESCQSFQQIIAEQKIDIPNLARDLDIARSILADLFNGAILPPIGKRLSQSLVHKLHTTMEKFEWALEHALNNPRIGHAKARETPTLLQRSYEDTVRTSNMSTERIQYWLSED